MQAKPIFSGGFQQPLYMGYCLDWYDGPMLFLAHSREKTYLVVAVDENIEQKTMAYLLTEISHLDIPSILLADHSVLKTIQKHAMQKQNGAHLFWVDYNDTVRSKRWIEWENTHDML